MGGTARLSAPGEVDEAKRRCQAGSTELGVCTGHLPIHDIGADYITRLRANQCRADEDAPHADRKTAERLE